MKEELRELKIGGMKAREHFFMPHDDGKTETKLTCSEAGVWKV